MEEVDTVVMVGMEAEKEDIVTMVVMVVMEEKDTAVPEVERDMVKERQFIYQGACTRIIGILRIKIQS
jgi:hypothetical protein